MEHMAAMAQFVASMAAVVGALGGLGLAATWAATRGHTCNPYGYGACACGCGTDCPESVDG